MTVTPVEADVFGPFDDVEYFEDDWRDVLGFRYLTRSGVLFGIDSDLATLGDSSGMQVKVPAGMFYIEGYGAHWTNTTVLPIEAYSVHRYDRVIVRLDFLNNTIGLVVLAGTTTTLPSLTQNTTIWEETIAWVDVDNNTTVAADHVHDERNGATGRGGWINSLSGNHPPLLRGRAIFERDTQMRMRWCDGTGWLWVPGTGTELGCDLASTAGVNLTSGAWEKVPLGTENWDHGSGGSGLHGSGDAHLAPTEAGIWDVRASCVYAASGVALVGGGAGATWADGAGRDRQLGLHLASGAEFSSGTPSHPLDSRAACYSSAIGTRIAVSKVFDLNVGDWVTLCVRQDQGADLKLVSGSMSARLIGYNI